MKRIKYYIAIKFKLFEFLLTNEEKEKLYIARLRQHFTVFGYDASIFTDQEIKTGFNKFSEAVKGTCLTADEMCSAFKTIK